MRQGRLVVKKKSSDVTISVALINHPSKVRMRRKGKGTCDDWSLLQPEAAPAKRR
ncbi:hypothetical protein [Geobacillus thermodenitrificans]|uniref:hypothetical protein n=1 Tax=Geobacillus thermodenitrificans TaxID=33940 RepID=UPI000420CF85|nr:hypothetical protein [Geobacillus thermodenitrificans]